MCVWNCVYYTLTNCEVGGLDNLYDGVSKFLVINWLTTTWQLIYAKQQQQFYNSLSQL